MVKMDFYVAKKLIREKNNADLKKAWEKFLKEQKKNEAKRNAVERH